MSGSSETFLSNLESSFLLTPTEKESLVLLCSSPELTAAIVPLLEEMLHPVFETEADFAPVFSDSVRRETRALARESELRERSEEFARIDTSFA
jgi:hypothetical protein